MKKRFIITITGKVQGVGFRYYVSEKAEELGVVGFVQNNNNGSVRVDGESDAGSMKRFIALLEQGPSFASVQKVDAVESTVAGYDDFSII